MFLIVIRRLSSSVHCSSHPLLRVKAYTVTRPPIERITRPDYNSTTPSDTSTRTTRSISFSYFSPYCLFKMNLYKLAQGKYHVRHIIFASNNHLDVFRANPQLHLAILLLASAHLPVLIPSFESTFRWRTALRLSPVVLFASSPSLIIPSSPYCLLSTTHFRYPHRVSHIGSLFLPRTTLFSFFLTFLSWVLSWHTSTPDKGHCCFAISPDVLFHLILTPLTAASSTCLSRILLAHAHIFFLPFVSEPTPRSFRFLKPRHTPTPHLSKTVKHCNSSRKSLSLTTKILQCLQILRHSSSHWSYAAFIVCICRRV
ncbi:hypothetical protein BS47DRAFT_433516 [Hydnum rufescens UP504]|uniref:Uncharacterized protein n=1 Tax=Hydnum rufescens UP504 TaxID=1448309 RepID=A0A9P6DQA1_9AGAM|nr:hypothetical protein BS47DRAFT_433516 [Hydnum rufescens UP504]